MTAEENPTSTEDNSTYYQPLDFANTIFQQRYSLGGEEGWADSCKRVANYIAAAEVNGSRSKWEERFFHSLVHNHFIPGGRIWYGAGRPKGQLLNCFVVPTEDSREGWGKTVSDMLIISGTGGGVGMNFSPIRPRGTSIQGTGGEATGAVSLMEVINQTGEVIKSGGGRRTALMLCLDYSHGDIMEFLHKKFNKVALETVEEIDEALTTAFPYLPPAERSNMLTAITGDAESSEDSENSELNLSDSEVLRTILRPLIKHEKDQILKNANISVLVDDDFFAAVEADEEIQITWRGNEVSSYRAKDLWDLLIQNAWESGEPGILNIGLANKMNNIHYHKPLISTNPCGEIWLEAYGCCDLGAINLSNHIAYDSNGNPDFDWELLASTITTGVRFLDNVLDVNNYPLAEIEKNCREVRRIGLGVMGLGHALVKLGLPYNRAEGRKKVDKLFNFIKKISYETSTYLSAEKGCFPAFDAEQFLASGFCETLPKSIRSKIAEYGMRNCAVLTIAPTGTTSLVAGTSSGIEPIFAAGYSRTYYADSEGSNERVLKTEVVIDPLFQELWSATNGSDQELLEKSFLGAMDIGVEDHLRMQVVCQKHIDNAVSKTINLPNEYPIEDFSNMMLKYGPQLKGTTVYRSGSRGNEPLTPMKASEAIEYLNKQYEFEVAAAMSDCPSGICQI